MTDETLPGRKLRRGAWLRYEAADGRPWMALTNDEQMRVTAQFVLSERAAMILGIPQLARRRAYMDWYSRRYGTSAHDVLAAEVRRQFHANRAVDTRTLQLDLA